MWSLAARSGLAAGAGKRTHHMRSMEFWEPPWLLNQSAKEMESNARTSRMPPSGSINARTMGDVPSANEFATCPNELQSAPGRFAPLYFGIWPSNNQQTHGSHILVWKQGALLELTVSGRPSKGGRTLLN